MPSYPGAAWAATVVAPPTKRGPNACEIHAIVAVRGMARGVQCVELTMDPKLFLMFSVGTLLLLNGLFGGRLS
jgi:hypothetical protein